MGRQPLVMQQARQAFDRRFLDPQAAGQLRLVTALFLNDRAPKGGDPFELMPRCPRQYVRAILREASSPRVLVCHNPRLARVRTRGYSPPNECVLTSGADLWFVKPVKWCALVRCSHHIHLVEMKETKFFRLPVS